MFSLYHLMLTLTLPYLTASGISAVRRVRVRVNVRARDRCVTSQGTKVVWM